MAEQTLQGSCLCKSVRYEVTTPFMRFGHCYCSRCRKATGGVRSTNIAVPIAQFHWTQGENLIKRFDLPEAKSFARQICSNCNCPVPHASRDGTRALVPAGTLDDVPPGKPSLHGHWSSRVSFVHTSQICRARISMLATAVGRLRAAGMVEAVSFLILLGVAMPLKYFAGLPLAVKIAGWIHGLLFLTFGVCLLVAHGERRWPMRWTATVFVAALLPFGPFVIDRRLKSLQQTREHSR